MMMLPEKLTSEEAYLKIKHYCAWQERCNSEVMGKLFNYGLDKNDADEIVCKLIEENYLNEERFAIQFAGGKFRIKQWGRVKINYELKQKKVSGLYIKKALAAIDEDDYLKTLQKLTRLKLQTLKNEKNIFIKKKKLQDFLKMKGYEAHIVIKVSNEIVK